MNNLKVGIKLIGIYFVVKIIIAIATFTTYWIGFDSDMFKATSSILSKTIAPTLLYIVFAYLFICKTKWVANLFSKDIIDIE